MDFVDSTKTRQYIIKSTICEIKFTQHLTKFETYEVKFLPNLIRFGLKF